MVASGVHLQDVIDQKDYMVYKSALSFDENKILNSQLGYIIK